MSWALFLQWAQALVMWAHVMSGIAWIGASFYFIALDLELRQRERLPAGVLGEAWQVHAGGFYQIQKFGVAPATLPEELTWFKWEAYTTWIFGFILLILIYLINPNLYLIDPSVMKLSPVAASLIAALSLGVGWVIYDLLCRSPLGRDTVPLSIAGFILLIIATWIYAHIFAGRGAYIEVGALTGSIMAGNVFFIIIPNQKKVVAALLAGKEPDPRYGHEAKQRSIHNNYLTLPVVFIMISNHYANTYGTHFNWVILIAIFIAGFFVRYFFNIMHAIGKMPWWAWGAAAVPVIIGFWLSGITVSAPAVATAAVSTPKFSQVVGIVKERCAVCHAEHPTFAGFSAPPLGVRLDTKANIVANAQKIYQMAVATHTMPLGDVTKITDKERAELGAWVKAGAPH